MIDGSAFLSATVALLAILSALGAGSAFLSVGRQRGRVEGLRGDIEDRDKRIVFLEGEVKRHAARVETLQREVDVLSGVVTGEAHLTTLTGMLEHHHKAALGGQEKILGRVEDVIALVGGARKRTTTGDDT